MKRKFRLRKSTDFKRVRRNGTSYAHPLVVLIVHPKPDGNPRFGVSAGRSVGNAIRRNRAKRRIRAILEHLRPYLVQHYDIVVLARKDIHTATHPQLHNALVQLCARAGILNATPKDLYLP